MMMNFHCETAREVPLKELRSRQDLDPLSWQENFSANYIYIYIYIYTSSHASELTCSLAR